MTHTAPTHTVTQVSILNALLARRFDGLVPCGDLLRHGDFGIGTYDRMDGEMILVDGTFYQGRAGGEIHTPDPATLTPFATVCRFVADQSWDLTGPLDYAGLDASIDAHATNHNAYLAIRVEGTFPLMRIHALVEQHEPYPPTAEVVKGCVRTELTDVRGTIVGFRGVPWVRGINDTSYHRHFITEDRTRGGRVAGGQPACRCLPPGAGAEPGGRAVPRCARCGRAAGDADRRACRRLLCARYDL